MTRPGSTAVERGPIRVTTHRVTTSINPDQVIEVSGAEHRDLRRMGLIRAVEQDRPVPAPKKPPARAVPVPRMTTSSSAEKENSNG